MLGVVIPALNEEEALPALLSDLSRLEWPHQVVVSDGGSTDGTRDIVRDAGAILLESPPGRASQMNDGANALDTPWLLFLHADSRVPAEARSALAAWLGDAPWTRAGFFRFKLEGNDWFWRFIELGQRIRERTSGLVYGDQGLVVSRKLFLSVGGYPELPILEDVEVIRALRRQGTVIPIQAPIITSPRRYREGGRWRGWLRNVFIMALYLVGWKPQALSRFYPPRNDPATVDGPEKDKLPSKAKGEALLVFAKSPRPGQVKTRLAADVGDIEAARIYTLMGRRVVDQVRGTGPTTTVFYDPPDSRPEVESWLGTDGLDFRPQAEGDLGARLEEACHHALRSHSRVVVVGTDAPELTSEMVKTAFHHLRSCDVVLGPAEDGGYYLIALRKKAPGLFREIPWSTHRVLDQTLAHASELGLSVFLLPRLSDVDTLSDWERVAPRVGLDRPSGPAPAEQTED